MRDPPRQQFQDLPLSCSVRVCVRVVDNVCVRDHVISHDFCQQLITYWLTAAVSCVILVARVKIVFTI